MFPTTFSLWPSRKEKVDKKKRLSRAPRPNPPPFKKGGRKLYTGVTKYSCRVFEEVWRNFLQKVPPSHPNAQKSGEPFAPR
jgi:hypothetical protein